MRKTAWEFDDRPVTPCVVCGDPPAGRFELPRLPDVHVVFAGSAICEVCRSAGQDGDAGLIRRRAEANWVDDGDLVSELVRLVLAASGHPASPRAAPRKPPERLTGADAALWARLEPLVYDGPAESVVVGGSIEYMGNGERTLTQVLLAGKKARLSDEQSRPWLITDGVTMWRRGETGMVASDYRGPEWGGRGSELAHHRIRGDVELFGFGEPIGPIERTQYLGRPAWRFAFAAPPHKPYDMLVVIDDATGLTLEQRFGDASLARWTEFTTDETPDTAVFVWDGPVITAAEIRDADRRDHEVDMARRKRWFAEHVTSASLVLASQQVEVLLHDWNDDGSFQASLSGGIEGSLARRPRSSDWWRLGWSDVSHRWSDDRWDWALSVWDFDGGGTREFDADAVGGLIRALGSSPPAA